MKISAKLIALWFLVPTGCVETPHEKFVAATTPYANYSTVEWQELRNKYYRPNAADWDDGVEARFHEKFPQELAAEWWHLLQNARIDFHHKSLPVRSVVSPEVVRVIEHTETLFDTVFVRCIEQEYYMRLLPEMYNEVLAPAIDELIETINQTK